TADQSGPKHLQMTLTRAKFEDLCAPLFDRLRGPCVTAIKDAGLNPGDVAEVVLVGGSTRIPKVQEIAKEIFGGKEPNRSINPDEVVAVGAAIQGGVLQGEVKDVLLLDVTPLSLGVETKGGIMTKLIEKNTTIPTSRKETFSTAADGQTAVTIHVLQGERDFASDNRTLGRFDLSEIPPAPAGMPQIEVEFAIDANGILSVSATDKKTGKSQRIEIKGSSGLSNEEIEKMKRDAEQHAADDKARRELIDLKNQAEQAVLHTRRNLKEHGDKVDAQVRGDIESAISRLEDKLKEDDKSAIESAMEHLQEKSMELGRAVYEAQQAAGGGAGAAAAGAAGGAAGAGGGPSGDGSGGDSGDDVIDAEYEVKDDRS
ncbi:MAG: Hsp70 family protein, partial [Planctomycetota bacterium]